MLQEYHVYDNGALKKQDQDLQNSRSKGMQQMSKDSTTAKIFTGTGLVIGGIGSILFYIAGSGGSGGAEVGLAGLALMAASAPFFVMGSGVNYVFTNDFTFVSEFSSKDWRTIKSYESPISFSVNEGETVYLGDLLIQLSANGGKGKQRRKANFDIKFTTNKTLQEDFPNYKNQQIITRPFTVLPEKFEGNF
jgi:hypothetical protein